MNLLDIVTVVTTKGMITRCTCTFRKFENSISSCSGKLGNAYEIIRQFYCLNILWAWGVFTCTWKDFVATKLCLNLKWHVLVTGYNYISYFGFDGWWMNNVAQLMLEFEHNYCRHTSAQCILDSVIFAILSKYVVNR
jgi:hypothetical protein